MGEKTEEFTPIERGIFTQIDFLAFQKSDELKHLQSFMRICTECIVGKACSDIETIPDTVNRIVDTMVQLNAWIDEIPPLVQPSRFGNKAFRIWFDRLCRNSLSIIQTIVGPDHFEDCKELGGYLEDSFGNASRVDYGTGHETTFFIFLCCLYKAGVLHREDLSATMLIAFPAYLKVCRHLQTVYWLEPAGSHGVWCLDDYQLLPFVIGSAQLIDHPTMSPSVVLDKAIVDTYSGEFMYFEAIKFINLTKTGPFEGHSPLLYTISQMPSWRRVYIHLQKYWVREVLGKFPVMQHLRFGKWFPMSWEPSRDVNTRKLEYVKPPERDDKTTRVQHSIQSHMANGMREEFISIHRQYSCVCYKQNSIVYCYY